MQTQAQQFVDAALQQDGKPYIFGTETRLTDSSPPAFDCSELVEWAAKRAGLAVPDGSAYQLEHCRTLGTLIAVSQAKLVRGALLFRPGHVAISLGDGRTIEARGAAYGVGVFDERSTWTHGALVPGMRY